MKIETPMPVVRIIVLALLVLLAGQVLAAFHTQVSEAQITKAMRLHFPAKEYATVARVELDYPQVSLSREKGFIDIRLSLSAVMAGKGEREGTVTLRAGLSYKPASGELYLSAPQLTALEVKGINGELKQALSENVDMVLQNVIPLIRIYQVNEKDLNHSLDKSTLKSFQVEDGELKLEFGFK